MKDPLNPGLLAALCHDLRGPLGALGTWVHVLNSDKADGEMRARALAAMASDVRAMGSLIEQLSMLASTLSASEAASISAIEIVPFLTSMIEAAAAEKRIEVRVEESATSLRILADPIRLRQVFWPFLSPEHGRPGEGSRFLTVTKGEAMATIEIESRHPSPLTVALVRALAESQGGHAVDARSDGKTVLGFGFRLAP